MGIVMSIQYYDVISKHPCFFLGDCWGPVVLATLSHIITISSPAGVMVLTHPRSGAVPQRQAEIEDESLSEGGKGRPCL